MGRKGGGELLKRDCERPSKLNSSAERSRLSVLKIFEPITSCHMQNPTVEWKICRRCGTNKPAADFYRNKTNGDGLYNNCKACFSHDAANRRDRLPPLEERTAAAKECRRCKETKPAAEFYKNKHMSDGLYTHCKASLLLGNSTQLHLIEAHAR